VAGGLRAAGLVPGRDRGGTGRAYGLPTFPDPHVDSSGVEMQLPKGLQPNSPVFRAAQQACKNLMPGLP
jgi:hypothetical protein